MFPEQHVESTRRIPRSVAAAFDALVERVSGTVRQLYGPLTAFEHGSCRDPNSRRSACLAHAHIHLVPGWYRLERHLRSVGSVVSAAAWVPTAATWDSGYLFLQEPGALPLYGPDPGISQFFRRRIAEHLEIPDEWDYLLYPRLDNVHETVRRLDSRL